MRYYVYVLMSSRDNSFYIGCTSDLRKRFILHNKGQVVSTKHRRPLKMIYCEFYPNKDDAFAREKFLKTGWGRNYIKRALKNYLRSKKLGR